MNFFGNLVSNDFGLGGHEGGLVTGSFRRIFVRDFGNFSLGIGLPEKSEKILKYSYIFIYCRRIFFERFWQFFSRARSAEKSEKKILKCSYSIEK